jgi:hypothetical protein
VNQLPRNYLLFEAAGKDLSPGRGQSLIMELSLAAFKIDRQGLWKPLK